MNILHFFFLIFNYIIFIYIHINILKCSVVKEISRINELEIRNEINLSGSWHDQYKDSAYIFIGGIPYDLSEQDVICVFSQ